MIKTSCLSVILGVVDIPLSLIQKLTAIAVMTSLAPSLHKKYTSVSAIFIIEWFKIGAGCDYPVT
jgi:hypothetical protein